MTPDGPAPRLTMSIATYRKVSVAALALLCCIVVTGAAVRLSGSGLGCSDWPNCEPGQFIEIGDPNQAIEQLNRMFTGLVSVVVIAAVLGALLLRPRRRDLIWLSLGLVAGVLAQIVLGGITVLVDLHPVAVAGHFTVSMLLVVDATVLVWRAGRTAGSAAPAVGSTERRLSWLAMAAASVVLVFTGPMLTGAGPHAGDGAAPRFSIAITTAARIHSLSAWAFCVVVLVLLVRLHRAAADPPILARGRILLLVIVVQGTIGYAQYEMGIPAWLVAAHVAGATAIAVTATWFHLGLFTTTRSAEVARAVGTDQVSL